MTTGVIRFSCRFRHRKARGNEEAELDADIDDLLDGGAVHDSIMDESDEEEDEVGGLLDGNDNR